MAYRITDKITYNFWLKNEINESDMRRFIENKIKWNLRLLKTSKEEIDRLIAFQCACDKKGLTSDFIKIQKEVISELKRK